MKSPPRSLSKAARRFAWTVLVAGAVATPVLLEGSLRVYHGAIARREVERLPPLEQRALVPSDDPALVFGFRPGFVDGDFTVNAWGMPDDEVETARARDTFRIAVVGDSISAGFRLLPRRDLYVSRLESLLGAERPGTRVEVLNFGVNGYGIGQLEHVLRSRVAEFRPDVVIVQFCLNDPYTTDSPYGRFSPTGLRLVGWIRRLARPERALGVFLVERNWDEAGFAAMRKGITAIGDLGRTERVKVIGVLFPYLDARAYDDWGYGRYHAFLQESAAAAELPWLDLYTSFRESGVIVAKDPPDALHPTAKGHRIAAERIAAELRRRGWDSGLAEGGLSGHIPAAP